MWRYALLGPALVVAGSSRTLNEPKRCMSIDVNSFAVKCLTWWPDGNSSTPAVSGSPSLQGPAYPVTVVVSSSAITTASDSQSPSSGNPSLQSLSYSVADVAPSFNTTAVLQSQSQASLVLTYAPIQVAPDASSKTESKQSVASIKTSSLTSDPPHHITLSSISAYAPSKAPYPYKNGTATSTAYTSTITRGSCTGCALAALNPLTTAYQSNIFGNWTSLVVTETILTEFVTYLDGSAIDTVVTELKTVNQTKTVDNMITDTWANFNVYLPTPGLELTLEVGPTYVIYTSLFGGPDAQINATHPNNATYSKLNPTQSTCQPHVSRLGNFAPTRTEDWDYFIQTFNGTAPKRTAMDTPLPVPTKLVDFLAQDPNIRIEFQGADIVTCTLADMSDIWSGDPNRTFKPPAATSAPAEISVEPTATETRTKPAATTFIPPVFSSIPGTNTYLSTTYASTSRHITRQGCLRCDTNPGDLPKTPQPTYDTNQVKNDPTPTASPDPKNDDTPKSKDTPKGDNGPKTNGNPQNQPQNTPQKPDAKTTPSIPDIISSIISSNPELTKKPQEQPTNPGQAITISNSVVTIRPQPTWQGQGQQTNAPTMVVIGTRTVTVGQTTTINGVPVIIPTGGRGSTIIVGDKTIGIGPQITQAPIPVITFGYSTITANPQGQFVVGTNTLQRGGPLLILDDNTLTLGPNGKIAIWNSATQTLATMAGPSGLSAVTFGGQANTAKVLGGTTVFVLNDKTLAPGSAVTIDGTTFSLPPGLHGSSVVINGQTQRLSPGLPALTINNSPITATVVDGTTKFVLAPGETLTPGGVLTISGTTYSLPTTGLGSTIVINGATSRLNPSHLPVFPLSNEAVTATVAHGTTAFVFGPDQTLTLGGVVTVSGTTISLPASGSGSVVVINGVTSTLAAGSGMAPTTSAAPIVVDGKTVTASTRDGTTEYVFGSATTLRPDGEIVIDGTTYSLAPGGTALVVNGKTSLLSNSRSGSSSPVSNSASTTQSSSATTSGRGAGDFIASGIGESSRGMGSRVYSGGANKWAQSLAMGLAGWLMWLL